MKRRNTVQKQKILETASGAGKHLTAEEIAGKTGIPAATVYRNLNLLCEEGVLRRLTLKNMYLYDGNPEPHDHFICTRCGRITDLEDENRAEMIRQKERDLNVTILRKDTIYEGICRTCGNEEEKQWN